MTERHQSSALARPSTIVRTRLGLYARLVRVLASAAAALVLAAAPAAAALSGLPAPAVVGKTVLLAPTTTTSGCELGANPDRRCSPGAYYSKLTKAVVCSASFHTGDVRYVPDSEKHAVEVEYGMAPKKYGSTLEIDHIVSLELGGSNDIANLYPEKANAHPGYHAKDKLENRLHAIVCAGATTLRNAQRRIAADWQALYKQVFGTVPTG